MKHFVNSSRCMTQVLRYIETARYLRPRQLAFQIWRRLQPASWGARTSASLARRVLAAPGRFLSHGNADPQDPWAMRFLNVTRRLQPEHIDWRAADAPKLWRYNLHYFDFLLEENRATDVSVRLLDSWIDANPVGTEDAWEPYTVSLRVVNWIKFFIGAPQPLAVRDKWIASLRLQCAWLTHHLERHVLANHLLKNAKALLFGACYFKGPAADSWLRKATQLVSDELDEQFLADGGHFERSPMYHAICTHDLLDLVEITRCYPDLFAAEFKRRLARQAHSALAYLAKTTHPDGEIALFNDAAFGIAPTPGALAEHSAIVLASIAPRAQDGLIDLPATGYAGWRGGGDYWLMDIGEPGPAYQPGHAHCDLLSYELSLGGLRIVVDSGVYDYESGVRRRQSRSTAGHNTVMVDGEDQSDMWGVFRVARRARPQNVVVSQRASGLQVCASHDGFRRLSGRPLHTRTADFEAGKVLLVQDVLTGGGAHRMENFIHLHPLVTVIRQSERLVLCTFGGEALATLTVEDGAQIFVEDGEYFPEFGVANKNVVVRILSEGALPLRQTYRISKH